MPTGRPWFIFLASPAARCGLVALAVVATRVPLRTHFLANWDADQFALGLTEFDVVHHQPHPPGYLGYLLLGHALMPLAGGANSALVLLSIAGQVAAAVLIYLWARSLFGELAGALSALAFAVSPLAWYYGEVANTYALEPALVLAVAWPAWRCWKGVRRAAVPIGLALGLAGAIRPSTAVFMAPLAVTAVAVLRDRGLFLKSAGLAIALTAAWVAPLLILAGGPARYLAAATALGSDVTAATAIWKAGPAGLRLTAAAVVAGTVWELGGFAVLLVFALAAPFLTRWRVHLGLPAGWLAFAALWVLPGLLTFLFVHIGQLVYVQQFTPLLFVLSGPAVLATARTLGSQRFAIPITAAAVAGSLALLPGLLGQLRGHDRWVGELRAEFAASPPDRTLLVADAYAAGSYRTAQVYLPGVPRVGVGRDQEGRLGTIFSDVYRPENFQAASPLSVPPGVDTLVFLDRPLVERYVGDADLLQPVNLPGGDPAYVWHVPHGEAPVVRGDRIWLGTHKQFLERRGLR